MSLNRDDTKRLATQLILKNIDPSNNLVVWIALTLFIIMLAFSCFVLGFASYKLFGTPPETFGCYSAPVSQFR